MPASDFNPLIEAVKERQSRVQDYLFAQENRISFDYQHLEDAVYSYLNAGGKSLRSAVMMFCCGAVGGDENTAIPAAAAIELYHTFTLVHDDIIDRDDMRRGVPTIHVDFAHRAEQELGFDPATARHYGLTIAILVGDMQQGWAASLLPDLHHKYSLPAELALNLTTELFRKTQIALINGETVDVKQSATPADQLDESDVLDMLRQKTGLLYEFAGRAGAAIGLKEPNLHHPTVEAVATFANKCGVAFQLQDDVLGVSGDAEKMGKAVGADIREGKRTVIVLHSLKQMTAEERHFTLGVLGNRDATDADVMRVMELLKTRGGIDHAMQLAEQYVQEGLQCLDVLPESDYKTLLKSWAGYIIRRDL